MGALTSGMPKALHQYPWNQFALKLSTALCFILASLAPVSAVQIAPTNGTAYYNNSDTVVSSVPSWSNGWGRTGIDGWSYVGSMNGASGVYLGNGWVITAGHVGAGNFTLNGNTYNSTGYSYTNFTASINGTNFPSDLNLFQISTISTTGNTPNLPSLTIASSTPTFFSNSTRTNQVSQSQVVMIGFGGGQSWGVNNVTGVNQGVLVNSSGNSYGTTDFSTTYGSLSSFYTSITNNAKLVTGDSGGGDFMKIGGNWVLAGINEATDSNGNSYMVQLSSYASVITNVIGTVPSALSYMPSTISGIVGTPITNIIPSVNGTVSSYSINPALPSGLSLNTSSGLISGTPSAATASSIYTITATNSHGWTTTLVTIAIAKATPTIAVLPTASSITSGQTLGNSSLNDGTANVPGNFSWTFPATIPPEGIGLYSVTFTPSDTADYNTLETNVSLTVTVAPPSGLSYSSAGVNAMVGQPIAPLTVASVSGGAVTGYSVSPTLPSGLSIDGTTGTISGTPSAASPAATYTVTASNSAGSTSTGLLIGVSPAPVNVSIYPINCYTTFRRISSERQRFITNSLP